MSRKEIVGLVPVKGNSDRVLKKNTRPFGDTTLLDLKLSQLKKATGFSDIYVSSEDSEILEIASSSGFLTHYRHPKYSTSEVPMSEVYSYIGSEIPGEHIAWINITNPLAGPEVYSLATREYDEMSNNYDCLLSAFEIKDNIIFRGKPVNFPRSPWPRSQDLEPVYSLSFVVNVMRREKLIEWGSCVGESPYFFLLDQITSWDIDFPVDFEFCEWVYTKQKLESQGTKN
ncbi:hypothetical protein OAR43_07495 [Gammaproteobacteria bacterium]|nr:hypothetical protein [Gammaproteobacteria bacterium]